MFEYFRSLAVHQAKFHKHHLDAWSPKPDPAKVDALFDGLVHDALWLTKFPLLYTPTYGISRLDLLNKTRMAGAGGTEFVTAEILALRTLVDADVLRFILALKPADLDSRIEIFFGGRAMNKALWQYLAVWFDHAAFLRSRFGPKPSLLDTVFE